MIEFSIAEKHIIIAILIAIMEADGIIDPHEIDYLDGVILSFGMSEFELDAIDECDYNQIVAEFKKFDTLKKDKALVLFLEMAKCDGYADPRELQIISSLA